MLTKLSKEKMKQIDRIAPIVSMSIAMTIAITNMIIRNNDLKFAIISFLGLSMSVMGLIYLPMRIKRLNYDTEMEEKALKEEIKENKRLEELKAKANKLKEEVVKSDVDNFYNFLPLSLKVFRSENEEIIECYRGKLEYMGYYMDEDDSDINSYLKSTSVLMGTQNMITVFGFEKIYSDLLSYFCYCDYQDKCLVDKLETLFNQLLEIQSKEDGLSFGDKLELEFDDEEDEVMWNL